ncbi:hypothetical protein [Saccharopolyspora soli]|uniref:hypothetical protein n=1 Tax=Saccharopolyspora soli TaxID=2926618 RepID=UPI00355929C3
MRVTARWVVLDIEGPLTPTSQVHVVLYDYARPRLGPWIDTVTAQRFPSFDELMAAR